MTGPWPPDAWYLQLADLTVDLRFRRVIHSGQSVELPQRIFDLLLLFLAEPDTLHTRTELFERLWAGTVVEDTNLSQNIWLLRKALGEERKAWIRTVAKSGYVFQAPEPLRWFMQEPPAVGSVQAVDSLDPPSHAHTLSDAPAAIPLATAADLLPIEVTAQPEHTTVATAAAEPIEPVSLSRRRRRWWAWAAAAAATIAIALAGAWFLRSPPGDSRMAVALVTVEDKNTAAGWPAKLLEQWLEWKLGSLPQVNLLKESDLASGDAPASVRVVFLSSVPSARDPAKLKLHARFQFDGEEQRLEAEGNPSDMPALVDAMSRQIVSRLQPDYARPWPALDVGADAARDYAQVAQALDRRDWMTAAKLGEEVVVRAPRFGLLRLQLVQPYVRMSLATSAIAQMDQALKLLADAPPPVMELMQARRLAIDPARGSQALAAYARLADRYPYKAALQLDYAWLLIGSGEAKQALERLADPRVGQDSLRVRIDKRLLRADAYGTLGDPQRLRANAEEAERLARDGGPAWNLERAGALVRQARADVWLVPERGVPPGFEQAARLFEQAGNATGALHARVLARLATNSPPGSRDPELEALLARANADGYRRLEIDVLLSSAMQYLRTGDIAGARSRYLQASAIAAATGDLHSTTISNLMLLNDDLMAARLDSAQARIGQLTQAGLSSAQRISMEQLAAEFRVIRGDFAGYVQALERIERLFPPTPAGQMESEMLVQAICMRSQALVRLGQLARAREDLKRCGQGGRDYLRVVVVGLRSGAEMVAGHRAQARELLDQAEQALPAGALDRWISSMEVARQATRQQDYERSQRLYAQALPPLQSAGYQLFVARVIAGQAENAAANGDWPRSRELAAQARASVSAQVWDVTARLDLLAAADARQHSDAAQARALASSLHRRAQRHGDVIVEMEVHGLFPPGSLADDCSAGEREALVERTQMRGVGVDWLRLSDEARGTDAAASARRAITSAAG